MADLLIRIEDHTQRSIQARRLSADIEDMIVAQSLLAYAAELDAEVERLAAHVASLKSAT